MVKPSRIIKTRHRKDFIFFFLPFLEMILIGQKKLLLPINDKQKIAKNASFSLAFVFARRDSQGVCLLNCAFARIHRQSFFFFILRYNTRKDGTSSRSYWNFTFYNTLTSLSFTFQAPSFNDRCFRHPFC
eukprot:Lithocolla_globosa_v1_NODE_1770_length_2348_cov_6.232883.p3 type:complete len:130 gc:universal NODE_1770_length_2348_cov_6.232883:794-405(-)